MSGLLDSRTMAVSFYEHPILNSPYALPTRHHALDGEGQPLDLPPVDGRRRSKLITPVPRAKKKAKKAEQTSFVMPDAQDLSTVRARVQPHPNHQRDTGLCGDVAEHPEPQRLGRHASHGAFAAALAQP